MVLVVRPLCSTCVSGHACAQVQPIEEAGANAPASFARTDWAVPYACSLRVQPNPVDVGGFNLFHRFGIGSPGSGLNEQVTRDVSSWSAGLS